LAGVRAASARDLDRVAALWIALTEHHAALDPLFALRRGAEGEVRTLIAAQLRDPDVGCFLHDAGGLCIARVDRAPPIHEEVCRAEITDLFVAEGARRRGIGGVLARTGVDWARGRGASRIEVRVSARNPEGQAFWRAAGFADFMDVLHRPL